MECFDKDVRTANSSRSFILSKGEGGRNLFERSRKVVSKSWIKFRLFLKGLRRRFRKHINDFRVVSASYFG